MSLSLFMTLVLGVYFSAGKETVSRIALVKPLLPFLLIIMLLHVWAGSVEEGIAAVMRLLVMILLANIITMTTRMSDMMTAITPVFRPLEAFGFSSRRLSIAVSLMIRFVPVLFALLESLTESWRARSSKKPRWHLLTPLTLQALKMADSVGDALQSRGGAAGIRIHT